MKNQRNAETLIFSRDNAMGFCSKGGRYHNFDRTYDRIDEVANECQHISASLLSKTNNVYAFDSFAIDLAFFVFLV